MPFGDFQMFKKIATAVVALAAVGMFTVVTASPANAAPHSCFAVAEQPTWTSPNVYAFGIAECGSTSSDDSIGITTTLTRDGVVVATGNGGRCWAPVGGGTVQCSREVQATNATGNQLWCTSTRVYNYATSITLDTAGPACESAAW
jgi:hypothetical protein